MPALSIFKCITCSHEYDIKMVADYSNGLKNVGHDACSFVKPVEDEQLNPIVEDEFIDEDMFMKDYLKDQVRRPKIYNLDH